MRETLERSHFQNVVCLRWCGKLEWFTLTLKSQWEKLNVLMAERAKVSKDLSKLTKTILQITMLMGLGPTGVAGQKESCSTTEHQTAGDSFWMVFFAGIHFSWLVFTGTAIWIVDFAGMSRSKRRGTCWMMCKGMWGECSWGHGNHCALWFGGNWRICQAKWIESTAEVFYAHSRACQYGDVWYEAKDARHYLQTASSFNWWCAYSIISGVAEFFRSKCGSAAVESVHQMEKVRRKQQQMMTWTMEMVVKIKQMARSFQISWQICGGWLMRP